MNASFVLPRSPLSAFSKVSQLKQMLPCLLKKCSSSDDLESLQAAIFTNNLHHDPFTVNQFLAACGRLHRADQAWLAFTRMAEPNVFVYNAMIKCLVNCSAAIESLHLFAEMSKSGHLPTPHTFSHLIKTCAQIPAPGLGEAVHGQVRKSGFIAHLVLQTGLIDFYCNILHRLEDARKVFDEMIVRDTYSWNTMIFGCTLFGRMDTAHELFDEMPERNAVSWNTMIAGYARLGDAESASALFKRMSSKNMISWTSMISCYSQNKMFKEALETFDEMSNAGIDPDRITMAAVISACAHLGALGLGRRMHRLAALNNFTMDVYIGSALIDMYAKCGSIEKSLVIFFNLEDRNLFCWNSIIDGLALHGRPEQAFYMFSRMTKALFKPNGITFVSILSACSHAGLVEEGRRMFSSMVEDYSIAPEIEHYSCMVDLLARAGFVEEALDLIRGMEVVPNSILWGALLSGCKVHGKMEVGRIAMEKLEVLDRSKRSSYNKSPGCSLIEMNGVAHENGYSLITR